LSWRSVLPCSRSRFSRCYAMERSGDGGVVGGQVARSRLRRQPTPASTVMQAKYGRGADPTTTWQCRLPTSSSVVGDFTGGPFQVCGNHIDVLPAQRQILRKHDGPGGQLADHEIKYTFGVHPLQQYLIELPGGGCRPLPSPGTRVPGRPAVSTGSTSTRTVSSRRRPTALDR
jgi:hypothetical protein